MLGAVLSKIFKDTVDVQLHSFPSPNVKSGSFVYDISLNNQSWQPNTEELRAISAEMVKLAAKDLKFERLEVIHDLAFEMFKEIPFKREQLPSISKDGSVVIYRIGDHIDISRGPMVREFNKLFSHEVKYILNAFHIFLRWDQLHCLDDVQLEVCSKLVILMKLIVSIVYKVLLCRVKSLLITMCLVFSKIASEKW